MSADQDALIHKVVTNADGEESNFVFVVREALDAAHAAGRSEGYAGCLRDRHQAEWLAEAREKRAATAAESEN